MERAKSEHTNGLAQISKGCYSTVYSSDDTPYIVKIMRGGDAGYLAYMKVIQQLGDSPYCPRIQRVVCYRYQAKHYISHMDSPGESNHDYYAIYMEKLEQPPRYRWDGPDGSNRNFTLDKFVGRLARLVSSAYALREEFDWMAHKPKHRDLIALLVLAREQTSPNYCVCFDIHSGNVMKRGRQYVVTDPLA